MNNYDDNDRERPSWSEIDKRKDQSRHVSAERDQPKKSRLHTWAARQYRKELERLWMGKKGSEECRKALSEIHKRHGTPKFHTTVKAFIKEYGLPDDWETLFLLLDYRDVDVVREVMDKLKELYPDKGLTEMQGFRAKLDIMASTSSNEKLRDTARMVLMDL